MARGRKTGCNRVSRNNVRFGKNDSDDSDEDYIVGKDEEFIESEEEDCSLVEDESDDGFLEFIVDKETNKAKKKVGKPGCAKVSKPRKKKVPDSEGEDDDDSYSKPKPKRKNTASYQIDDDDDQEEEDVDYDESDDDYDEEFTPDEIDFDDDDDDDDDDEDLPATKTNKACKLRMQETQICKVQKRKKNDRVLNKVKRKKPTSNKASTINIRSDHDGFRSVKQGNMKIPRPTQVRRRRRKQRVDSDSEFLSSGSSDYDFCGRRVTSRSLNSSKMIEDKEILRKYPGRKGKEKVVEMKVVVAKQVCGICLSEEGKRTVRGILNCCSHYFCFACIMEWSKVESRCPLCKQRFTTLCRSFLEDGGHGLRDSLIQIPERDQVYRPSEEELRSFLDPYEDVLCTECLQGGDDALMLLCDVCDSPAHAYCVGLGREVPEGNWYCNGCRPTSHLLLVGSSPASSSREMFDLNELYVPETPSRQSIGDIRAASPGSGSDAFTLLERRQSFRSRNRRFDNNSISLFGSTALQNTVSFSRLVDNGSSSSRSRGQVLFNQGSTSISRSFGPLRPCTSNRH